MSRTNSKHERWTIIFRKEGIGDALQRQGWYQLSAKTLKARYGWEPRLLAKIDDYESLPPIFRKHHAAILSLSNDRYVIVRVGHRGRPFFPTLPSIWEAPQIVPFQDLPQRYHTFKWEKAFTGESEAIDAACASRILHSFVNEENLTLTIRGRRRFSLDEKLPLRLRIDHKLKEFRELEFGRPQMEVDAGYETPNNVYLVESKLHLTTNFNPRQVFFPYIYWRRQLKARRSSKNVRPIYLLYTHHFYYLYELEIQEEAVNAIRVTRQQWYILGGRPFTHLWLDQLLARTHVIPQPQIPFPQADLLPRLYDLLDVLHRRGMMSIPQIAEEQHFTERQAHYYASAAKWLGWVKVVRGRATLTSAGKQMAQASPLRRLKQTLHVLTARPVFYLAIRFWCKYRVLPTQTEIRAWIASAAEEETIKSISGDTIHRRAQTVRHWLQMLAPLVDFQA